MKISRATITLILLFIMALEVNGQYWQSSDGPVPLFIDSNLVRIRLVTETTDIDLQTLIDNSDQLVGIAADIKRYEEFAVCSLSTRDSYLSAVGDLAKMDGVYMAEPFYRKKNGDPQMFGVSFCVLFDSEWTKEQVSSLATEYGVKVDRKIGPNTWVFKNRPESGYNIVNIANLFHDFKEVRYALPDFEVQIESNSYNLYDYYNDFQYHIKKVIGEFNGNSVWDFAGLDRTVNIAIVDDGLAEHDDLPPSRILPGYDFYHKDTDATPGPNGYHGLSVAGIIGASHATDSVMGLNSNSGIISMNPYVDFIPIKIFPDALLHDTIVVNGDTLVLTHMDISHSDLSDAMEQAYSGVESGGGVESDIVVCCWNFRNDSVAPIPELEDAIGAGYRDGRLTRGTLGTRHGTLTIFSAGNNNDQVMYPARLDSCFAVGAIDTFDIKQTYSSYGDALDLVTYSASASDPDFWSLDQMGEDGYNDQPEYPRDIFEPWDCGPNGNDWDYNCRFGGTSAAAPVVAGVASLLLSRDSSLSVDTLISILKNSAVRELMGGTISPPDTLFGYGRLDAYRAMLSIVRGDVNNDAKYTMADITYLMATVYSGGPDPIPDRRVGNVNCDIDDKINLADITALINIVYLEAPRSIPCYVY